MRILFTSTPGLGHFHPLLPFLRAARAAGDDVLVAIPADGVDAARRQGFDVTVTADPSPAVAGAFWSRLSEQSEPNTYVVSQLFGRLRTTAALPDTMAAVARFRPDLVVSECMELSGQVAAELAGVPHVTVGIGAMRMAGLSPQPLIEEVDAIRVEAGLDAVGVEPWWHRTRFVTAVPPVLWRSVDDLPADTIVVRHEDPEGPIPRSLARVAPSRRPRVYATLGSVAGGMPFSRAAYPAVLAGLGALDADVLFTVGAATPEALGPIPSNVTIASYVPQRVAMACDVVVTHGGSGTTVAAISRGLPIVAVPLFADQPHNASRLEAAGIGITVPVAAAATALPMAVRRAVEDPGYRDRARRLAIELATLPKPGEALESARLQVAAAHA